MKMDFQVQRIAKVLNQCDRTGMGCGLSVTRFYATTEVTLLPSGR